MKPVGKPKPKSGRFWLTASWTKAVPYRLPNLRRQCFPSASACVLPVPDSGDRFTVIFSAKPERTWISTSVAGTASGWNASAAPWAQRTASSAWSVPSKTAGSRLPHHIHASATQLALSHGKHVLVEKPIATTLEEARIMIDAARRSGLVFMVAEDVHFRPAVREAALAIDRGDIGEPLFFKAHAGGILRPRGWKADASLMGGGVLMDLGVHYIRALRMILGEPDRILTTRGMQIDTKMAGEDSVQVLFGSPAGWQAHLLLNWAGPRGHNPDIIISGDQGVIQLWPATPYYDWFPAEPRPIMQLLSYVRPSWLAEKLMRPEFQQVRRPIAGDDTQGYLSEIREFLAAIDQNRPPQSDPIHAMRDLEIVLCGYAAMQQDEWVRISPFSL
jgi:predicted dehydrogenase